MICHGEESIKQSNAETDLGASESIETRRFHKERKNRSRGSP